MARGLSVHVGLNSVDPAAYGGWNGELAGCENDANDMAAIVSAKGYVPTIILSKDATLKRIRQELRKAGAALSPGDEFIFSYSGHGGQVPDTNGEEEDGLDETWALFDGQLVDDELYEIWGEFQKDVSIIVFSDSCHSGTMLKLAVNGQTTPLDAHTVHNAIASSSLAEEFSIKKDQIMRPRVIPLAVQREANKVQAAELDRVQKTYKGEKSTTVNASVLLLSGCQDNQTSSDGLANGLFTQKLKQVWNKRKPSEVKSYTSFYKSILKAMPPWQTPNQYSVGLNTKKLSASAPFSI